MSPKTMHGPVYGFRGHRRIVHLAGAEEVVLMNEVVSP
jgi:hypothetical protein